MNLTNMKVMNLTKIISITSREVIYNPMEIMLIIKEYEAK
jgi:hypothetical protein